MITIRRIAARDPPGRDREGAVMAAVPVSLAGLS